MSTVGVFFRDMEYLWNVVLMLIMYTSAIFYMPERLLKSGWGFVLKCNPLYCTIACFRDAIFGRRMEYKLLLFAFVFSIAACIVGVFIFKKNEDKFILNI